jgi:hypothetical protein
MQRNENRERTIFQHKMAINKQRKIYRKLIGNTKILELENLRTSAYKTKCKWQHEIEKLVQNRE